MLEKYMNQPIFRVIAVDNDLINTIIPHIEKYPLLNQKRADFELFKLIIKRINEKEHNTVNGINKFLSFKASMN